MVEIRLPAALAETARFEVHEYLGSGGFGVVWSVKDKERGARVALKWLKQGDAAMIARFKREFRALADLGHPNLIEFRDLLTVGEEWFFTMELIDGIDLLAWVRPASGTASEGLSSTTSLVPFGSDVALPRAGRPTRPEDLPHASLAPRATDPNRPLCVADLPRVRTTFQQLAAGLMALHGADMLHRDIKPSNVLVTREGRVVLLDFGLVTEIGHDGIAETMKGRVVGTPAYMSPEQALGMPVSPASDWYSVGAILYQVLTGALPYEGDPYDVLFRKQLADPPPPSEVVRGVPPALSELCMALLSRKPEERPIGAAFLERLRAALPAPLPTIDEAPSGSTTAPSQPNTATLVGREAHLWALDEALREAEAGRTVVALVHGRSGMGKSALVRAFLDMAKRDRPEAVVLEGRCYEREAVPYKALDSLADALCRYLTRLPEVEQAAILPRDLPLLAKVFPVFLQLRGATAKKTRGAADVVQERRRAFEALRELLQRIGDRCPLVLFVDDLQWGDADSEPLLLSLLRGPDAPALLFIAAYRTEDASSPLVRALADVALGGEGVELGDIPVGELSPQAARQLAEMLVFSKGDATLAEDLARESCGSPLFLRQLAALGREGEKIGLSEAVKKRVEALPEHARKLLEVLAVSGRPLSLAVAAQAAEIVADRDAVLSALRRESLVRSRPSNARDEIEIYHDRIREVVAGGLSPETLAARHKALAHALASSGGQDAEALALHSSAAGERELASSYAQKAAMRAEGALAFDRAARMYAMALELAPGSSGDLELRLAEALACAGRGRDAGERFLAVASRANGSDALEWRRRAAEQLLFSGHLDRGLEVIEDILQRMGMRARQGPFRTVLSLLWRRLVLRVRGLRFKERRADQIARDELVRIDTCFSLARGLGIVDPFRGAEFQTRFLLLALGAGDPVRIAMGTALEGAYRAAGGVGAKAVVERLLARGAALAAKSGDTHARGLTALMRGVAESLLGDFRSAVASCDAAYAELREKCVNVTWELDNAAFFACFSLFILGRAKELERRVPGLIDDARARGDLYGEVIVRAQVGWFLHAAKDDIASARADLDVVEERWSKKRFLVQHAWKVLNEIDLTLYEGEAERALRIAEDAEPRFREAFLLRATTLRVRLLNGHGRAALAAALAAPPEARQELLRTAETKAQAVSRETFPLARGFALLLFAGIAHARRSPTAEAKARQAVTELEAQGMVHYASAAKLLLAGVLRAEGEAAPATDASELERSARAALGEEGVRDALRFASMFAPTLRELREETSAKAPRAAA